MMNFFLSLWIICVLFCGSVFAQQIPSFDGAVTDIAGVLSEQEESSLESLIAEIRSETTVEMAVLLVNSTSPYDISSYAFEVGNAWGVGKSDIDNGLVLVIAVKDRKWFTATGYGLEATLPDILTERISRQNFPNYFRVEDYGEGIATVLSLYKRILEGDESVRSSYTEEEGAFGLSGNLLILHVVVTLFIFTLSVWRKRKDIASGIFTSLFIAGHFALLAGGFLMALGLSIYGGIVLFYMVFALVSTNGSGGGSSGSWGSGGGWSSGGGGSSFSGFSGGSFGGGGSGGSW